MKRNVIFMAAVICLGCVLQGQSGPKKGAYSPVALKEDGEEASLLKLTREWVLAEDKKDQPALRRLLADDFVGTSVEGTRLTKEKLVAGAGPNSSIWSFTAADYTTKTFGNLGVVTGNGTWKDTNLGQLTFTLIYKKRMQSWQIINLHISKIPE